MVKISFVFVIGDEARILEELNNLWLSYQLSNYQ